MKPKAALADIYTKNLLDANSKYLHDGKYFG